MASDDRRSVGVHQGVQKLYGTHWSYNWSDLPLEQEKAIEEAFERVQWVHDRQTEGNDAE